MTDTTTPRAAATPSTPRSRFIKQRYFDSALMLDIEYIRHYTASHRKTDGLPAILRRATNHASAIRNITPVIHESDRIVGNKTRFIRGAIPYANYASSPFLREMRKQQQDAQQNHAEQGHGGGIAKSRDEAAAKGMVVVSGKFLIGANELSEFHSICEYWEGKSFMDQSDALWKERFSGASFIEDGWKIGLYTAPHEPCPEGRLILDYETVLSRGLGAILAETRGRISGFIPTGPEDAAKLLFLKGVEEVLAAALDYCDNHAAEAERLASAEQNPDRKTELLDIAAVCRNVPRNPPRNFREAIQAFWFTYLLGHIEGSHLGYSPGRLDMVLFPHLRNDPTTSFAQAVELFEELFVKMTQIEYIASLSWQGLGHGNLYQNLILGGVDGSETPADNAVSMAILQAQINMQMTQPTLSVWHDNRLSEQFLFKAAECVKTGVGYPAFFNQRVYVEHEHKTSGIPKETIRKYAAIGGCTEPTLMGMAHGIVQAGFVNLGKLLDLALNDGVCPVTGLRMFPSRTIASFNDIDSYFKEMMQTTITNWQQYWNLVMVAHRETVPLVYCSALVRNCLETGRSMDDGGAALNQTPTTLASGMVNVANSFAVLQSLCFTRKVCSFEELKVALSHNWEGYEELRKKALNVPHWGNDNDEVDAIFLNLFDSYCAAVRRQKSYLGHPYDPSMLAISTPVPFGRVCAAFPDGRKAGEPLADGVTSPFPGSDKFGPTAVLRSSGKVDHSQIRGGLLNLKFHPSALKGENGSRNLLALIKTYFEYPTFHLQFNVVDSTMLREAQRHPENYRDLVVRVAGFSAYWVEMSKALQDQVIERTEHAL
jgi:formate C-acetyltransferase/4-hydroxyphenylacetate decarboxylase large subunit